MSVSGNIDVTVDFSDATSQETKSVLKTISLIEASEGLTGKIAIVSGTVSAAQVLVTPPYRNANGDAVTFPDRGDGRGGFDRIALKTDSTVAVQLVALDQAIISSGGQVAITSVGEADSGFALIAIDATETVEWTVLIYADSET